jgi:hypothetical protein
MTRSQRRWHFRIWLILAPLIAIGLLSALLARPPIPIVRNPDAADRLAATSEPVRAVEGVP